MERGQLLKSQHVERMQSDLRSQILWEAQMRYVALRPTATWERWVRSGFNKVFKHQQVQ